MREIKFRGKSKDTGKWVSGDLQLGDGDHIPMIGEVWCGHDPCYSQVEENTIGQFTGLWDKDGSPIYEGDIVRYYNDVEDELILGEVIYKADICSFRVKPKCLESTFLFAYWQYEVIGNIHDNPELLEERQ